jgi:hypothetical protein
MIKRRALITLLGGAAAAGHGFSLKPKRGHVTIAVALIGAAHSGLQYGSRRKASTKFQQLSIINTPCETRVTLKESRFHQAVGIG